MTIIDLSHSIQPNISVYPGDEAPIITNMATIAQNGYQAKRLIFNTHTGTHIDAPAHLIPKAKTLDQFPAQHFVGQALIVDCRTVQHAISRQHLESQINHDEAEFILLLTGWDRHWQTKTYLSGFPVLSPTAAKWLAGLGIKGIGLDCLSLDKPESTELPNHRCFLEKEIVIIENLTNLNTIANTICQLYCLPLLVTASDAAPARVIAIIP